MLLSTASTVLPKAVAANVVSRGPMELRSRLLISIVTRRQPCLSYTSHYSSAWSQPDAMDLAQSLLQGRKICGHGHSHVQTTPTYMAWPDQKPSTLHIALNWAMSGLRPCVAWIDVEVCTAYAGRSATNNNDSQMHFCRWNGDYEAERPEMRTAICLIDNHPCSLV